MDASILREQLRNRMSQRNMIYEEDSSDEDEEAAADEENDDSADAYQASDASVAGSGSESASEGEAGAAEVNREMEREEEGEGAEQPASKFEPWVLELPTEKEQEDAGTMIEVTYATPKKAEKLISSVRKASRPDKNAAFIEHLAVESGATTREDLERLGVVFLNLKRQVCRWLLKFEIHVPQAQGENVASQENVDAGDRQLSGNVVSTDVLFHALKRGDALCALANDLYFGECIKQYNHFEDDGDVMEALHAQDNIAKFLKACIEVFHVPADLLFSVADLFNNHNMPKVVLSLRAIAQYAQRYCDIAPHLYWPEEESDEEDAGMTYAEDEINQSSAEMSKLDVETLRRLYRAGQEDDIDHEHTAETDENKLVTPHDHPTEDADFNTRRDRVGKRLKHKLIESTMKLARQSSEDVQDGASEGDASEEEDVEEEFVEVRMFLASLGMSQYYDRFILDGWEDMDIVAEMTERDLIELGMKKRGHIRKLCLAISRLKQRPKGRDSVVEGADANEKKFTWRLEEQVPANVSDASSIWKLVCQLQTQVRRTVYQDRDTARALEIMVSMVEREARSLIPFYDAVVIDIGWDSIKYGFLHQTAPSVLTSLVAKWKTKRLYMAADQLDFSDLAELELRKPMHRGVHSITERMMLHRDDIERLLVHILKNILKVNVHRHPIFIVEPAQFLPEHREYFVDILAKKIGVPALYVSPAAPVAAHSCGLNSCIVVDVGESRSTSTAIYKCKQVEHSIKHSPVGADLLRDFFMQLLVKEGIDLGSVFTAHLNNGYMSSSTYLEKRLANKLRELSCVVSSSSNRAAEKASDSSKTHCITLEQLPEELHQPFLKITKQVPFLNVPSSVYLVAEALFQPNLIRQEQLSQGGGLRHIIQESIQSCPESIRAAVSKTIVLVGGMSKTPGFVRRLREELKDSPHGCPEILLGSQPEFAAWRGGALIAREPTFQKKWILKTEVKQKLWKTMREGPLPLVSPEQNLGSTNKALAAMHFLSGLLRKDKDRERRGARQIGGSGSSNAHKVGTEAKGRNKVESKEEKLEKEKQQQNTVKQWVAQMVTALRRENAPENVILDVKLHLSRFAYEEIEMDEAHVTALLDRLPAKVKVAVQPYLAKILPQLVQEDSPLSSASSSANPQYAFTI